MEKYLLAHDLGTSGNKATLFSEKGVLASSTFALMIPIISIIHG